MCFKNLPIEFDSAGKARLIEGADPFAVETSPIKQYVRSDAAGRMLATMPARKA